MTTTDPGDGHALVLRINSLNSVDTSTVLEITFSWYRLVCSNGMMFGLKDSQLPRRHIQSLDPEDIAGYLKEQIDQLPKQKSLYDTWFKTTVEAPGLVGWIDEEVAKKWGPQHRSGTSSTQASTARSRTGPQSQASPNPDNQPERRSWSLCSCAESLPRQPGPQLDCTRNTIPERLEYVKMIPQLVAPLTKVGETARGQ